MNAKPNREQFAEVVADAYFSQYVNGKGVMNNPVIDFDVDKNTFSWCSSLTPNNDNEIRVLTIFDGIFGDLDDSDENDLASYIEVAADDLWREVVSEIAEHE